MKFREDLGVIACRCVVSGQLPVRFVSHAGGDWQMYCHYKNHDFESEEAMSAELCTVHVAHLLAHDPSLHSVADLPIDMGAEREAIDSEWTRFEDSDDE